MGPLRFFGHCVLALAVLSSVTASAQEEPARAVVPAVTDPPGEAAPLTYDEYRLQEMRRRARVSRNALIGTSTALAVGVILFIPGVGQCDRIERVDRMTEVNCSTAGALLLGFGVPLLFGGGVGAIATGIMLGVRKRRVRDLKTRVNDPSARRVRWDPATARFVF
ncbi:MAG: hypothetical protein AAGF12_41195 [Myxococcota bacterium]